MRGNNLSTPDFFSIPNALFRFLSPPSVPVTCSFDVRWHGPVTDRSRVDDPVVGFSGEFVLSHATMTWSAATANGFRFESNPADTVSAFAQLGQMHNGVFFPG
jgi:hypothetical protein